MANEQSRRSLVLASGSRTRHDIMKAAGLSFTVDPADIDEEGKRADLRNENVTDPAAIALELAIAKAIAISKIHPEQSVIGSDQVLSFNNEIFAKPQSREDALAALKTLRGQTHELHSAVVIAHDGKISWRHVETAHLEMRNFSDAFADDYLVRIGDDAFSSPGSYQIEGAGIQLFKNIHGDHFAILGLPLLPLLNELRRQGDIH